MKIVETINGEKVPRKQTRYISGNYYKIGDNKVENSGDCYFINERYYRSDTGYILYDHRAGEYAVFNREQYVMRGIIDFDDKDNPVYGGFSIRNDTDIIEIVINHKTYILLNEDIVKKTNLYLECLESGRYYNRFAIPSHRFVKIKECDHELKRNLDYDSRNTLKSRISIFNNVAEEKEISSTVSKFTPYLKGLSFGLEFETSKGFIPDRITKKLGLIPLKDGSIEGLEYVTIPHSGETGVQSLIESLKQLKRRTEYDDKCSLHLHIGNVPRTEEFILALFKLLCFMQDDIFKMFPLYKKYNFGYKRKHYTKPFNLNKTLFLMDNEINSYNIKRNFNILFEELSGGLAYYNFDNDLNKVKSHPSDPNGTSKWNIKSRYLAHNLIPLIFGNKETVEFRIHTPTYDVDKVMFYLFICSSLINYAIRYTEHILTKPTFLRNIDFFNIFIGLDYPTSLIRPLNDYVKERTNFAYYKNAESKIHFSEDQFKPMSKIDWLDEVKTKKVSNSSDSIAGLNEALRYIIRENPVPQEEANLQDMEQDRINFEMENDDF